MKCPKCANEYFYPDNHIAYFDRQFESWAEAAVYKCDNCGGSEFTRMPLGSVMDNMGEIPDLKIFGFDKFETKMEPNPADDDILKGFKFCRKAHDHQSRGEYPQAASCALEFCRIMEGKLDVIWFAWAVSLAEKAEDERLLKEAKDLYLKQCMKYKADFENREFLYRAELLVILNGEIARINEAK